MTRQKGFLVALSLVASVAGAQTETLFPIVGEEAAVVGSWRNDAGTLCTSTACSTPLSEGASPDDADHVRSGTNQAFTQWLIVDLDDPSGTVDTGGDFTIRCRYSLGAASGADVDSRIGIAESESAVNFTDYTDTTVDGTSWVEITHTAASNTVSDWNDAQIVLSFKDNGGSPNRVGRVSWCEVEVDIDSAELETVMVTDGMLASGERRAGR